jgi:hypothetical protein
VDQLKICLTKNFEIHKANVAKSFSFDLVNPRITSKLKLIANKKTNKTNKIKKQTNKQTKQTKNKI